MWGELALVSVVGSPVINFGSVVAFVDRFPVLSGIDLVVEEGELVRLRGANGSGKTSLLKAIAGLLRISQGAATVLGYDLAKDAKQVRPLVGLFGHKTSLYDELTVAENINFALRVSGHSHSAADHAIDQLALKPLAEVPVERLSQGQRRRCALAILLARDPQLWLLDEPHSGLDIQTRELLDELLKAAKDRGRTVVFSSHEDIADLPFRTVEVNGGAIVSAVQVSELTRV